METKIKRIDLRSITNSWLYDNQEALIDALYERVFENFDTESFWGANYDSFIISICAEMIFFTLSPVSTGTVLFSTTSLYDLMHLAISSATLSI